MRRDLAHPETLRRIPRTPQPFCLSPMLLHLTQAMRVQWSAWRRTAKRRTLDEFPNPQSLKIPPCAGDAHAMECLEENRNAEGFGGECRGALEAAMERRAMDFRLDAPLR